MSNKNTRAGKRERIAWTCKRWEKTGSKRTKGWLMSKKFGVFLEGVRGKKGLKT
jgi:hypothetical protein